MDDYAIIGWPECQSYMHQNGWKENSSLIEQNDHIGIGSSTYLVSLDWIASLDEEELYNY